MSCCFMETINIYTLGAVDWKDSGCLYKEKKRILRIHTPSPPSLGAVDWKDSGCLYKEKKEF